MYIKFEKYAKWQSIRCIKKKDQMRNENVKPNSIVISTEDSKRNTGILNNIANILFLKVGGIHRDAYHIFPCLFMPKIFPGLKKKKKKKQLCDAIHCSAIKLDS